MNRTAKTLLVLALVGVVGMAFRVSWNALRDVARAIGADHTAAMLYPFVVDGLMALALVATLVLTDRDRAFALRVLATYTLASLVLNYVHGLVPALHGRSVDWGHLADWNPANWALVLLATSLPVGSIYFGSDLVAKVLHHRPAPTRNAEESTETIINRSTVDLAESTATPVAANPLVMPRPVQVGFLKPILPHKPAPAAFPPIEPRRAVAADSTRPRRATGRVPQVARSPRPKRTPAQLLDEARAVTAEWPEERLTAEGIRLAVHTSPKNARTLRETLRAERTAEAVA
ncbi:DUF2637 domain-containing protein [Streptomyces sp. NBC_00829]|uniref:DUF2637 domain-containing protein n=1 Tax=Streptomyces sp. NBC_00829 TaxID=2903679 RepID=UPI00386DAE70|nr:DUF2637 domain-containing protein [Streptomyces sp. NBC_00829]